MGPSSPDGSDDRAPSVRNTSGAEHGSDPDAETAGKRATQHAVSPRSHEGEQGGDPVCWLTHVCPDCGRFVEEQAPTRCPRCGAEITGD
jgi:rubrerythrin